MLAKSRYGATRPPATLYRYPPASHRVRRAGSSAPVRCAAGNEDHAPSGIRHPPVRIQSTHRPAPEARDDDLLRLGLTEVARQVVLNLRERDFLHSGFPNCASMTRPLIWQRSPEFRRSCGKHRRIPGLRSRLLRSNAILCRLRLSRLGRLRLRRQGFVNAAGRQCSVTDARRCPHVSDSPQSSPCPFCL